MPVQFTGTLGPGQYQVWNTWGWAPEYVVEWTVRPSRGQVGIVSLRALAIEAADDGTLTYTLTVWNVGSGSVTFDAVYTMPQNVADDSSGAYTLGAGQTLDLTWDFAMPPTLLSLMPVPQTTNGVFQCSIPSVQLNADGTGTYSFSVTNTGSSTAAFRMRAGLQY
jgi:hypothetical protein